MTASTTTAPSSLRISPALLAAAVTIILAGVMVAIESRVALAIALMEGVPAIVTVLLCSGAGIWIARLARLTPDYPVDRIVVGSGLGIGMLTTLVLILGTAGVLNRPVAMGLTVVLAAAGVAGLIVELRAITAQRSNTHPRSRHSLWLLVAPFLAIAAAAASLPPGVLWKEEGFGYDVLEYHLAVPKTFMTGGRIHFIESNVYSNFPLNSEMISLLMMHLRGSAIEAAYMATFANIALAALFVLASWWAASAFGRACGLIAGVAAASVPWITYLSGIAFVEVGMLAAGMAALGLLLHTLRGGTFTNRTLLAAGLLAGVSAGFKYTAIPMIVVLLSVLTLMPQGEWPARLQRLGLYTAGALIAFSPWLIRNVINTYNPVFPLAYTVFGSKSGLWDPQMQAVWEHAHGSSAAESNVAPLWDRALERTIAEPLTGWCIFVLASLGAVRRRDRWTLALLLIIAFQLLFWIEFTHLFSRFIVVMLLPLIVLAGRAMEGLWELTATPLAVNASSESPSRLSSPVLSHDSKSSSPSLPVFQPEYLLIAVLALGAVINAYRMGELYYEETRPGGIKIDAFGHTDWFVEGQWPGAAHWGAINKLPPDTRVMLVGEARTFYLLKPCDYAVVFNRHPLAEEVSTDSEPHSVMGWLRERGVTHLLVDWSEMSRLVHTYGFYATLTPELFTSLESAGLKRVGEYTYAEGKAPYATLFEVPRR